MKHTTKIFKNFIMCVVFRSDIYVTPYLQLNIFGCLIEVHLAVNSSTMCIIFMGTYIYINSNMYKCREHAYPMFYTFRVCSGTKNLVYTHRYTHNTVAI